jgi:hypothetical protein
MDGELLRVWLVRVTQRRRSGTASSHSIALVLDCSPQYGFVPAFSHSTWNAVSKPNLDVQICNIKKTKRLFHST